MTNYWIHLFVCTVCKTPYMVVKDQEHYAPELPADYREGATCRVCCNGSMHYIGKVEVTR